VKWNMTNLIPFVAERVNRPFAEKLMETQYLISKNIATHKNPSVACSGGKDSILVVWFSLIIKPDIKIVFNDTGVEYPETVKFMQQIANDWKLNLTITHPDKTFFDIADKFGYSISKVQKGHGHGSPCCLNLKEKPTLKYLKDNGIDCQFTGITASESRQRQLTAIRLGSCYYAKTKHCQIVNPIIWWTEDEVWNYTEQMKIPSNPIYHVGGYRKGSDRCGCMPCTSYQKWEATMRRLTPKLYAIIKLRKDKQYVFSGDFNKLGG
jgi:phosphoadenosine phosphosulfate reductase